MWYPVSCGTDDGAHALLEEKWCCEQKSGSVWTAAYSKKQVGRYKIDRLVFPLNLHGRLVSWRKVHAYTNAENISVELH